MFLLGEFATFKGVRRADAVIVGGGLTGLMTAAALCAVGMKPIVLDAALPFGGASGRCTGSVTLLNAPTYERIASAHGIDAAGEHVDVLRSLMAELPAWLTPLTTFREAPSYVYAFLMRDLPALDRQQRLCQQLGIPASIAPDAGGCPFPVELSMLLQGQLMVDVPPLLDALVQRIRSHGGQVYARSRVIGLEDGRVCTREGCVDAPVTILAAGKPPGVKHRGIFALLESRTMLQCRMTGPFPLHTCQQSVRPDGLNLRPVPGGMLVTLCAGRSGTPEVTRRAELFQRILRFRLPDWEAGALHIRQDVWTLDGLPVIGALPGSRGQLLMAAGYGGDGILGAALAARVLTRAISGRTTMQDRRYAPDRLLPREPLRQQERWLRREPWRQKWRNLAQLQPRSPVCTLCHCPVRYCAPTLRWECPVCGSSFGLLGALVNGPAVQDAAISALQRPDR